MDVGACKRLGQEEPELILLELRQLGVGQPGKVDFYSR